MVAYWDADQRCRFANRDYERWFGVSPEWLLGRHISELLGALYTLNLPHIQGALAGEDQEFEREIPDPVGGPPRHAHAYYRPDISGTQVRGLSSALVTDHTAGAGRTDVARAQYIAPERSGSGHLRAST